MKTSIYQILSVIILIVGLLGFVTIAGMQSMVSAKTVLTVIQK